MIILNLNNLLYTMLAISITPCSHKHIYIISYVIL